jgi:hypothetical protein
LGYPSPASFSHCLSLHSVGSLDVDRRRTFGGLYRREYIAPAGAKLAHSTGASHLFHLQWLAIQGTGDYSLKAHKCRASHLRPAILGNGKIRKVRLLNLLSWFPRICVVSNLYLDYVFVDEHNRHKRLKGMSYFNVRRFEH